MTKASRPTTASPCATPSARILIPISFGEYVAKLGAQGNVEEALEARGLLVRKSGVLLPTVAGILLLSASPQRFFPEAWVRVVEYEGEARLTGARANVISDRRFEGPLSNQLEEARAYLQTHVPRAIRLGAAGGSERFRPYRNTPGSKPW